MYEGRVEICSNGVWGTIYSGGWDSRDAMVICRQLGRYQPYSSMSDLTLLLYNSTKKYNVIKSTGVEVFLNSYFGPGSGPFVYAYLGCAGTESTLADCSSSNPLYYSGSHSYRDAGVRCNRVATTSKSDLG